MKHNLHQILHISSQHSLCHCHYCSLMALKRSGGQIFATARHTEHTSLKIYKSDGNKANAHTKICLHQLILLKPKINRYCRRNEHIFWQCLPWEMCSCILRLLFKMGNENLISLSVWCRILCIWQHTSTIMWGLHAHVSIILTAFLWRPACYTYEII